MLKRQCGAIHPVLGCRPTVGSVWSAMQLSKQYFQELLLTWVQNLNLTTYGIVIEMNYVIQFLSGLCLYVKCNEHSRTLKCCFCCKFKLYRPCAFETAPLWLLLGSKSYLIFFCGLPQVWFTEHSTVRLSLTLLCFLWISL